MKIQELLEDTHIDPEIDKILTSKGYKFLGSGMDQRAYLEPGGDAVLKIFGTDDERPSKNFTQSHRMFSDWARYCMSNSDNPFLVKFDDYESFTFGGHKYLQIRQEILQPLPKRKEQIMDTLRDMVVLNKVSSLNDLNNFIERYREKLDEFVLKDIRSALAQLGKDGVDRLLKTIHEIVEMGKSKGYGEDLRGDNFMMRQDGTPVIVDPWIMGYR